MRFIVMHKVDANMEAGGPPSQQIIEGMGALVKESIQQGVMTSGAGLHRSARRARVHCTADESRITPGPYAGSNELVASLAMISAPSMESALTHARRLGRAIGDVEIEVGPVVEPWDLGLMPKPGRSVAERFLLLCKAQGDERAAPERHGAAIKALAEGFQNDGALLAAETLAPSSRGKRLPSGPPGKRFWVDGPFAESKELIAGFSLLSLPSIDAAMAWANRYAAILGDNEVDVRELNH